VADSLQLKPERASGVVGPANVKHCEETT
jgi:hypothetical protein